MRAYVILAMEIRNEYYPSLLLVTEITISVLYYSLPPPKKNSVFVSRPKPTQTTIADSNLLLAVSLEVGKPDT